jgi:hypothetical protein
MGEVERLFRPAKLWFKIAIDREDASGEDVEDAVIEIEMAAHIYEAIKEGRARVRDFKVVGE